MAESKEKAGESDRAISPLYENDEKTVVFGGTDRAQEGNLHSPSMSSTKKLSELPKSGIGSGRLTVKR